MYETIGERYSDSNGEYEITVEVQKKFIAVNSGIPFLSTNPKFLRCSKTQLVQRMESQQMTAAPRKSVRKPDTIFN
jgi:hypothetical protein